MNNKTFREKVQRDIDYFKQYTVVEVNDYCYGVQSDNDSITATLIETIGLDHFLHCQIHEGRIIARFTYK